MYCPWNFQNNILIFHIRYLLVLTTQWWTLDCCDESYYLKNITIKSFRILLDAVICSIHEIRPLSTSWDFFLSKVTINPGLVTIINILMIRKLREREKCVTYFRVKSYQCWSQETNTSFYHSNDLTIKH